MKRIIVGISLLLLTAGPVWSMQLSTMLLELRLKTQDAGPTTEEYERSTGTLTRRLNIAQEYVGSDTNCTARRIYIDTVNGQSSYTVTGVYPMQIMRLLLEDASEEGTYEELQYTNIKELNREWGNYERLTDAEPLYWFEETISTSTTGQVTVNIFPPPDTTNSGTDKLRLDLYVLSEDLSADADVPFNGDPSLIAYHYMIIYKAAQFCWEDDRDPIAEYYATLYEKRKSELLDALKYLPAREGGIQPRIK